MRARTRTWDGGRAWGWLALGAACVALAVPVSAAADDWSMEEPRVSYRRAVRDVWDDVTMGAPVEVGVALREPSFGYAAVLWGLHIPFGDDDAVVRGSFDYHVGGGAAWSEIRDSLTDRARMRVTGQVRTDAMVGACFAARICVRAGIALRVSARRYPLTMAFDPVAALSFLGRTRKVDFIVAFTEFATQRSHDRAGGDAWDSTRRYWSLSLRFDTMRRLDF